MFVFLTAHSPTNTCLMLLPFAPVFVQRDSSWKIRPKDVKQLAQQASQNRQPVTAWRDVLEILKPTATKEYVTTDVSTRPKICTLTTPPVFVYLNVLRLKTISPILSLETVFGGVPMATSLRQAIELALKHA